MKESSPDDAIPGHGLGHGLSAWALTVGSDTDGLGLTRSYCQLLIDEIQWPGMTRFENQKWPNDFWSERFLVRSGDPYSTDHISQGLELVREFRV